MTVKLAKLKRSRRVPEAGDIFHFRLEDGRWFLGRVAVLGVPYYPGEDPSDDLVLVYVFSLPHDGSHVPAHLPTRAMLFAPTIVGREMWKNGQFAHLAHREFAPGERLTRHCLRHEGFATPRYFDEAGELLHEPAEPVSDYSVMLQEGIEDEIAQALGERPWWDEAVKDGVQDKVPSIGEGSVVLLIPVPADAEPRGLDEIEDPLIEAVEGKGVGEWEGHGYDADLKQWDIRFIGKSPKKMADAMLPVLKKLDLPSGSFLVVGGKRSKRIDL